MSNSLRNGAVPEAGQVLSGRQLIKGALCCMAFRNGGEGDGVAIWSKFNSSVARSS
jgi:hypothetical protein